MPLHAPHSKLHAPDRGFTTLELMVVIAAIAMVAAFASPFLAGGLFRRDASSSAALAVDALREAQSAVMSGKNGARYGVHFEADRFVLFRGAAYASGDSLNAVRLLDGGVRIGPITLTGGGSDVHFSDRRGVPTESGTVVFTAAAGSPITVTVGAAGMFDAN